MSQTPRRTSGQREERYRVEKELADRLRSAPQEERRRLYAEVCEAHYQRVLHHPQITRKASPAQTQPDVERQLNLLRRSLRPDTTFLEIGAGEGVACCLEASADVPSLAGNPAGWMAG